MTSRLPPDVAEQVRKARADREARTAEAERWLAAHPTYIPLELRDLSQYAGTASKHRPRAPIPTSGFRLAGLELDRTMLKGDPPPIPPFVLDGLVRAGDLVALVSAAKAGKSLLVFDRLLDAVADGKRVIVFDAENGLRDVHTRLHQLGHGDTDLSRLHYVSFPSLTLDEDSGAQELLAYVQEVTDKHGRPDLIVFDTASRFLAGDENDAGPWLAMYRLVFEPLKSKGIAILRLDHLGKDHSKGARGSSAKSGDVDAILELHVDPPRPGVAEPGERVVVTCTDQRSGTYPHHEVYVRSTIGGVLGHRRPGDQVGATIVPSLDDPAAALVRLLDEAGAPATVGRDKAREIIGAQHPEVSAPARVLEEAVRRRKARPTPVNVPGIGPVTPLDHAALQAQITSPYGPT